MFFPNQKSCSGFSGFFHKKITSLFFNPSTFFCFLPLYRSFSFELWPLTWREKHDNNHEFEYVFNLIFFSLFFVLFLPIFQRLSLQSQMASKGGYQPLVSPSALPVATNWSSLPNLLHRFSIFTFFFFFFFQSKPISAKLKWLLYLHLLPSNYILFLFSLFKYFDL